jgi:hypothetical protein
MILLYFFIQAAVSRNTPSDPTLGVAADQRISPYAFQEIPVGPDTVDNHQVLLKLVI